ncbi:type II toxin-antitoxin system VapC family toxin [Candidatus Woesearchaeota archaeon]|nr:type II toxin-antitoxin system VapC family toxin [Candidatus Woesearchaeota archaeon]
MIFIDANIFLAYDNKDDVQHKKAIAIWKEIEEGMFGRPITSDYILNEVVGVTFRKKGKQKALVLGEGIFKSMVIVNIDEHLLSEAWKFFSATELSLNLVDCTNVVVTKTVGAEHIATFDKEFQKLKTLNIADGNSAAKN